MKQAAAFIALAVIFLLPVEALAVSDHIEYNINVNSDGSASWLIIYATDIDSSVDSWEEFEQKLVSIIDAAKVRVTRDMALDWASLEMSTRMHWETSSKTIEYRFRWVNFGMVEKGQISFGDVFSDRFFALLYGDGELYVTYPTDYALSTASLSPNQRDDSTRTLHWYRTQDFLAEDVNIVLVANDTGPNEGLNLFAVAALGSGGIGIAAIGLFILIQRRRQKERISKSDGLPPLQEVESDQERILHLLKSSGGNMKQSDVCDRLRFSRAKTSMLLAEMEKNSLVSRQKKGRNKIVFPIENKEGRNM